MKRSRVRKQPDDASDAALQMFEGTVISRRHLFAGSAALLCACLTHDPAAAGVPKPLPACRHMNSQRMVLPKPAPQSAQGRRGHLQAVNLAMKRVSTVLGHKLIGQIRLVDDYTAYWDPTRQWLVFGHALLESIYGPDFEDILMAIAAHEVCHSLQTGDAFFDLEINEKTVAKSEKMADVFASFCLAMHVFKSRDYEKLMEGITLGSSRLDAVADFFASLGTDDRDDPSFHGTADDRHESLSAATRGGR